MVQYFARMMCAISVVMVLGACNGVPTHSSMLQQETGINTGSYLLFVVDSNGSASNASCISPLAVIGKNMAGMNYASCSVAKDGDVTLTIVPETGNINPSPWYAFSVYPTGTGTLTITLHYQGAKHRYAPKINRDGRNWIAIPANETEMPDPEHFILHVPVQAGQPFIISAQPLISAFNHETWMREMADEHGLHMSEIGKSVGHWSLYSLTRFVGPDKPWVILIGRQHPPEVTGAIALQDFVQALLADTELAQQFRAQFNLLIIPLLNPDGVDAGYWRLNRNLVDLNRDWGPFTQPETRAVRDAIAHKVRHGRVALFLDFHSTWKNRLYTQLDSEPTNPPWFARDWLAQAKAELPEGVYPFTRQPRASQKGTTAKTWMYQTYHAPSMTFEVGDDTPTTAIEEAMPVFAHTAMRTLLRAEKGGIVATSSAR